ncbi:MarR family winged helix-turn-helix transcriptional regulator [Microbacterium immunditiarum]|uniref:DNA-binding MarR family transcriptional regulator n=1 Tax=Microbacterium immunditiarum TaxID=337480 RepID=A0A7Y9GKV2_9MICO|nr:MarR family winged helix-turn-helix transcriptional regulator [Microbacterium immunditiarum]NYE18299.1 DNA-binding MarR family transcriptional regulator [Microbacterium immunditiarum]
MTSEREIDSAAGEDIVTEPLEDVIDPEGFTPRLLALLSNALVWRESTELRRRFGLGTNDWRVISAVALRPGISATEISDFIGVNKAVVSKSVSTLVARRLIVLLDGPRGSRPMCLTKAGARMHDLMLPVSMRGQEIILEGMPESEVRKLNKLLTGMLEKLREAQLLDAALEDGETSPAHEPEPSHAAR